MGSALMGSRLDATVPDLRAILLPEDAPYDALIARIAAYTHERSTLVVEARIAASALREAVVAAGGESDHLHILDATGSSLLGTHHEEVTPVEGAHLLETIAVRAKQLAVHKAERRLAVIIDDVAAFARANNPESLVQILHQARAFHVDGNFQEFMMHPSLPKNLQDRLVAVLDAEWTIGADGQTLE